MSASVEQQILEDLKKGVLLTGRLSEVHEKTFRMIPFIFFDEVSKVEISYDIVTDSNGSMPGLGSKIVFTISFKDGYDPDLLDKRVGALRNTVKTTLWSEVEVKVFDGKGKLLG